MSFSMSGGDDEDQVVADINVTPLVDVMLVLLVIFMITAPMLHQGVEVALPRMDASTLPEKQENPLVLTINRDGVIYLQDNPINIENIVEQLEPLLASRGDEWVLLKGDQAVPYGDVMTVMDVLRRGGIKQVGLVTQPPE